MSDLRKPYEPREPTQRIVDLAKATNLAIAGATYRQIAEELELPEETVRTHLLSPEGQRALRYAVNELQERTDRFLATAHLQALRRLVREMENAEKPSDRIRAAQAITSLAVRRVEISGADGGPIQLDSGISELLEEKISRMRERSRVVIEATEVPVLATASESDSDESSAPEGIEGADLASASLSDDPDEAHEVVDLPLAAGAPRIRRPADLSPGAGLRRRR